MKDQLKHSAKAEEIRNKFIKKYKVYSDDSPVHYVIVDLLMRFTIETIQTECANMDDEREKDIARLIYGVLTSNASVQYNGSSYDTSTCPFCSEEVRYAQAEMNEIKHLPHCAFLVAKDLSTGLNII